MKIQIGIGSELDDSASVLADAFAEYPVEIAFTADSLRLMCELDDVLLSASALARSADGRPIGVALAARRERCGRIAVMGVARDVHRSGVGLALGDAVLGSLRDAGAERVILEASRRPHSTSSSWRGAYELIGSPGS